jgi:hypothetical protein
MFLGSFSRNDWNTFDVILSNATKWISKAQFIGFSGRARYDSIDVIIDLCSAWTKQGLINVYNGS